MYFDETDVVRHNLVQRIIRAYDERKGRTNGAAQNAQSLEAKQLEKNGKSDGGQPPADGESRNRD
jgi:hypothetical protein